MDGMSVDSPQIRRRSSQDRQDSQGSQIRRRSSASRHSVVFTPPSSHDDELIRLEWAFDQIELSDSDSDAEFFDAKGQDTYYMRLYYALMFESILSFFSQ